MSLIDIYNYFVLSKSAFTYDQLKVYKSLESYNHFVSGWITKVEGLKCNQLNVVRGKVMHSMRINEKPLLAWMICSSNGHIKSCHCTCIAGLGESCSHVAALAFYCEFIERRKGEQSVTDTLAYWKQQGSKRIVAPKEISATSFQNAKAEFNGTRSRIKKDINIRKNTLPARVKLSNFLEQVTKNKISECALLKAVPPFCEDYRRKFVEPFPFVLCDLFKEEYTALSIDELKEIGKKLKFTLTDTDIAHIEQRSREQSRSSGWRNYRVGRITASVARQVCSVKSAGSNISLIKKICYASSTQIRKKAILWGCRHEKDALSAYIEINSKKHTNLRVTLCGLFVCKQVQFMAASPDGIVQCDCCGRGVLELKCPFCLADPSKTMANIPYIVNGQLLREHDYYYQLQLQMLCTGTKFGDFFVWSPRVSQGVYHVERVRRDAVVCERILRRSYTFFVESIIPELLGRYYTSKKVNTGSAA